MRTTNEDQLISAVKQVFAEKKSKFCRVEEMKQLLTEQGLTQKEVEQAISLALPREVIRYCLPFVGDLSGEPCYELLTEEDREFDRELQNEFLKKRWP